MSMLKIHDLHVSVADKEIVKGLDLEIQAGEVHAIMGLNGAGKSTLANTIAGRDDYTVTKGSIEFEGKDLLALEPHERVGEGIKITFASGILFDVNKSALQPDAMVNMQKLAVILNKYEDTEILIEGHTDATGSEDYNMDLSLRRAQSVGNYLTAQQVLPTRLNMMGYGETQPIATNETADGRQMNRRVEIAIFANDKLKKAAENQSQG